MISRILHTLVRESEKGRSMKKDDPKIQSIFEKDSGDVIEAKQQKGKVEKF